jgi:hypothetical protein
MIAWNASGGSVGLMTLTASHKSHHELKPWLASLATALRHLQNSKVWKALKHLGYTGSVRALELTWSPVNGWHPHYHFLLFFQWDMPADLQAQLYPAWAAALAKVGLTASSERGLEIKATYGAVADYVAKWGKEPLSDRSWGAADELTRAATKRARSRKGTTPFGLVAAFADTADPLYSDLFRTYATALKGRSQLQWSPGLRHTLLPDIPVQTDEQIVASKEDDAPLLGKLEPYDWDLVLWGGKRGQLLEAARRSWADVQALLDALVSAYEKAVMRGEGRLTA